MQKISAVYVVALCVTCGVAKAGPFTPQVSAAYPNGVISPTPQGQLDLGLQPDVAIPASSPGFVEWANSVQSLTRGPQNISATGSPLASQGAPANALGPTGVTGVGDATVSLGDGGQITVGFAQPITNGPGPDFAVFENGFLSGTAGQAFLELGTVSVSSDGVHFFTFPDISDTPPTTQLIGTGSPEFLDASNLYDLAGKYIANYGTPFDLQELAGTSPLLDVNDILDVRVTDVVGSINPAFGTVDSQGNLINDPWYTTPPGASQGASDGFDFDAIGVLNAAPVPEPGSGALALLVGMVMSPVILLAGLRRANHRVTEDTEDAGGEANSHSTRLSSRRSL